MSLWALHILPLLFILGGAQETTSPPLRPPPADPLPLSHARLAADPSPLGAASVYGLIAEQIHIALAGRDRVAVSWVTPRGPSSEPSVARKLGHHRAKEPSMVANCGMDPVRSVVQYGPAPGEHPWSAEGTHTCYDRGEYKSGLLHTAVLGGCCGAAGLRSGATYFYRVGDPRFGWSRELRFTMPSMAGNTSRALRVAVFGDLGQTTYSLETLAHMKAVEPDLTVNVGDLSYADGDQMRWDSWARMVEPLASQVPMMPVEGNHEEDAGPDDKHDTYIPFQAYTLRYFVPYVPSGSGSNLYYSFEAGGAHFVMIGSYAEYREGSPQWQWLEADLRDVDRQRTPWVVVGMHLPWYSSNAAHYQSGQKVADALEPLLYQNGVDLVFQAHVHAYERTTRVFSGVPDPCGPMYITIGDGGNRKGLDKKWKKQPAWSVVREDSFGFGVLEVEDTQMRWSWLRNQDGSKVAADSVLIRKPAGCEGAMPQVTVT